MLPIFNTAIRELSMLQTQWKSQLDPVIADPSNNSIILKNISLVIGTNTINTRLGRTLQGWKIVRQRSPGAIYDNQDTNQTPNLTLILISDAIVSIDLEIF